MFLISGRARHQTEKDDHPRSIFPECQFGRCLEGLPDGRLARTRKVEFQEQYAQNTANREGEKCQHDEAQFVTDPGWMEEYCRWLTTESDLDRCQCNITAAAGRGQGRILPSLADHRYIPALTVMAHSSLF